MIVRGADHGMHAIAVDDEEHLRRWMTGGDRGPQSELFIGAVIGWVRDLWVRYPS